MSPAPLSEERLAQLLRAEAERYAPSADGAAGIAARVAARRRARLRRRAVGGLLAAAVAVGIAVPVVNNSTGGSGHQVLRVVPPSGTAATGGSSPTRRTPAFAASNQLVSIGESKLEILSAVNGTVIRIISLSPPLSQPSLGLASVDPTGRTAYVSVPFDVSCSSNEIVAIDLRTGQDRVVTTSASDPVVSLDGTRLAYVNPCGNGVNITVANLRTGSSRSWVIARAGTTSAPPSEVLTSLAWAPGGRRLVIGSTEEGPASGIQILDTTRTISAGNPRTVGPYTVPNLPRGRYTDPALLPDGTVTAISPRCWGGMTCPPDPNAGDAVVKVDASNARVRTTLVSGAADPGVLLSSLAVDPSGRRLAVEGTEASGTNLYAIAGGRLHVLTKAPGAFGWVPRPAREAQTPAESGTAKSAKTRSAGEGTVEGTLLMTGGPPPGISRPEPGTVEVTGARRNQTASVGVDGHFSFKLPAGTYTLSGSSPNVAEGRERCLSGGPVQVVAGRTTRADVACSVP